MSWCPTWPDGAGRACRGSRTRTSSPSRPTGYVRCSHRRPSALDRAKKLPVYARAGVEHAWVLDAETQTGAAIVSRTGVGPCMVSTVGDDVVRAEPFAEMTSSFACYGGAGQPIVLTSVFAGSSAWCRCRGARVLPRFLGGLSPT